MASGGFNAQDIPSGMEQSQTPSQRLPGRLLPQELELWSMLTDERLRSEQHKMNYQALKSEHTRLQDEFLSLQLELKQTLEEYSQQKEKSQTALSQAQDVLQQKQAQIEELKAKLASQAPEVVQRHVQEKFERNFKGRCQELEQEADHYREEFNKLRYEHTMLKTQAEYLTTEHQRTLEEINFKHEGEINKLQEEVDQLREKQTTQGEQTGLQIRALQKENSQFRLRVKALLTEMEEVQAQREKSSLEAENNSRAQARQLTEQYATICTLESEKTSLNMQKEVVQKELSSTRETCNHLSAQLDSAKEEVLKLKGQLDEVEHTAQVKHTELKMEAIKDKAEVERERDRLASEVANFLSLITFGVIVVSNNHRCET
ncbi:centrosomal protein of 83 kDa-like isoform X2 [Tachypleus tridentatus]|uniref:centrosomal protein of 83 kDa-like isoform X2 n=1 Tax=Tachypleus tridentatus TaxID=6853 RepID=UPI003FD3AB24